MNQHIIKTLKSIFALIFGLTLLVACEDSAVFQDNSTPPR